MDQVYEISRFESKMPINCLVHRIGHIMTHTHDEFEIIFILSGTCRVDIGSSVYQFQEEDIFIVEAHTPHALVSTDCVYASISLDQAAIESHFPAPLHPEFECNSQIPGKEVACNQLRKKTAAFIKNNADKPHGYEIKNWIYTYEIMEILYLNFRVENSPAYEIKNHRYSMRVHEISMIIKEHYTEDLTLTSLADRLHLSVPYLSKFFMEQFGVNYLTYLTQLRIKAAVNDLLYTDKTLESISMDQGFPNVNAFTSAFKKEFGIVPSAYRRQLKQAEQPSDVSTIMHNDFLSSLKKYLVSPEETTAAPITSTISCKIDATSNTTLLKHTWKNMISVGQASDLLLAKVQEMLTKLQQDVGFQYIYFNGIFSDNMCVYHRSDSGKVTINFSYIDTILDFLQHINIKPVISFSFMPHDLAKYPNHIVFSHLVSEPSSISLWCELVDKFMNHIINRYGYPAISKWQFTVWHQANTPPRLYGFHELSFFYQFYLETYNIVKKYGENIAFGLPCMYYIEDESINDIMNDMLVWCQEQHCVPDFLNFCYYDTTMSITKNNSTTSFGFVESMTLSTDLSSLHKAITHMNRIRHTHQLNQVPLYISEWNNSPSQQDYLNDTCFKSCYLTRNILENYDLTDSLSYWSLTDLMVEHSGSKNLFFGGSGLFTINGLPKASYFAMTLLTKLGDSFISKGNGWFATKAKEDYRIITYNYKHYSDLYALGERFDMTMYDRYTMFDFAEQLNITITLENIPDKEYFITQYSVNRRAGSVYDSWVEFGHVDVTTYEDNEYLKSISLPKLLKQQLTSSNGSLTINLHLEPLEVSLLIIRPVN